MLFRLALIPLVGAMIGMSVAAPTEYTHALVVRRVYPHHRRSSHSYSRPASTIRRRTQLMLPVPPPTGQLLLL